MLDYAITRLYFTDKNLDNNVQRESTCLSNYFLVNTKIICSMRRYDAKASPYDLERIEKKKEEKRYNIVKTVSGNSLYSSD